MGSAIQRPMQFLFGRYHLLGAVYVALAHALERGASTPSPNCDPAPALARTRLCLESALRIENEKGVSHRQPSQGRRACPLRCHLNLFWVVHPQLMITTASSWRSRRLSSRSGRMVF